MSDLVPWFRGLAEHGGKGVVNNIDARCLGRAADEIESLRERLEFAEFEWNRATDGMKERDATIESLRAELAGHKAAFNLKCAELAAANEHFKKVEAIGHEVEAQLAEAADELEHLYAQLALANNEIMRLALKTAKGKQE